MNTSTTASSKPNIDSSDPNNIKRNCVLKRKFCNGMNVKNPLLCTFKKYYSKNERIFSGGKNDNGGKFQSLYKWR